MKEVKNIISPLILKGKHISEIIYSRNVLIPEFSQLL